MPRVLILYGTSDGHTAKVAAALAGKLRYDGCSVAVVDARDAGRAVTPEEYDGVIVGASIHIGGYQRAVARWVRRHATTLGSRPSAFVSVCLGILEERAEAQREVADIMQRFLRRCGWRPTLTKTVAGALPYTRYGWLKKWMMKRIVAKAGGGQDTTRDYEYTDWGEVRALAGDFARRLEARAVTGAAT